MASLFELSNVEQGNVLLEVDDADSKHLKKFNK